MEPLIFFTTLTAIYCMAFFFDRFFKSCMHYPYEQFLKNTGITVQFLRLKWYTTAFNRTVFKWGSGCSKWLTKSFNFGIFIALLLIPLGLVALFMTIFNGPDIDSEGTNTRTGSTRIEILLPGVNLPLDEIGFYITTLLISTVVHELGHALAAVLEDVPVTGFGIQIYFCLPLAYTEINSEHLNSMKWIKKLRIICGGIWHNVMLSAFCYLLLSSIGFLTSPIYIMNESVIVTEISHNSPLRDTGDRGLETGDIITRINDCRVRDISSWYSCLVMTIRKRPGFCVSSDFIHLNDESIDASHHTNDGIIQCCDSKNLNVRCFEYIDDLGIDEPIEIPQHVCLNVRQTIKESYDICNGICNTGFCFRPLLSNTTTILNIKRISSFPNPDDKPDVIYIGHPGDIAYTVKVSPFVPKFSIVSPRWGDNYLLFLKYNIVFSMGLAALNALPCFGFDGYHISSTIINSFLANRIDERAKRDIIVLSVTGMGTVLFLCAVLKVLWLSIVTHFF